MSSGANVDGAPLPEDVEENGKEEEVGEFGFHTLVGPFRLFHSQQPHCATQQVHVTYSIYILLGLLKARMAA